MDAPGVSLHRLGFAEERGPLQFTVIPVAPFQGAVDEDGDGNLNPANDLGTAASGAMDRLRVWSRPLSAGEFRSEDRCTALNCRFQDKLQKTMDLQTWTDVGSSFLATESTVYQDVEVTDEPGIFRVLETP